MKQFLTFVRKEFAHVFRDRKTLLMLFGLPVMQIVLFGFALTNEIKNARIAVVGYVQDGAAREIMDRIQASRYFDIHKLVNSREGIEEAFREGKVKLVLVFPASFNEDLVHLNSTQIEVLADASDPNTATTLTNYVSGIIADYQASLPGPGGAGPRIGVEVKMLYNPQLQGQHNFVPGVMALVLMLICVMMTSISIVREKELGTMEVLLVSPFRPLLVVISKAVPYFILSVVNLIVILLLSIYLLDLPVRGSIVLLFAISMLFIITALALGLLISTRAQSQQSAMLMSMMGMLLPTMLFTGFMFPIENMPVALQAISNVVPARWYYVIVKDIMIKGQGFAAVWKEVLILLGMTLFFMAASFRNFKIRLA